MKNIRAAFAESLSRWWPAIALSAALGLLAWSGWWGGQQLAVSTDADLRGRLIRQAVDIARSLNTGLTSKLAFTAADKGAPAYEVIREQLTAAGTRFSNRGIYSLTLREGTILFGPGTYPENNRQASRPGTPYLQRKTLNPGTSSQ